MLGFGKKKLLIDDAVAVASPVAGRLLALDEVPDPVISRGMMGPGFAVDPENGRFCSPVDGTIVLIAKAAHAVGIRTANGAVIMLHAGLGSVSLCGEGIRCRLAEGERVITGQPVLEVDLELLRARVPSLISPVIVANGDDYEVEGPFLDAVGRDPVVLVRRR